jgi:hypothetical protein
MLQRAEVAALAAENARLNDLKSKADTARDHALRQHSAAMERQVVSVVTTMLAYRDAFRSLVDTADKISKNLPKHLKGETAGIEQALSADNLRLLAQVGAYHASMNGVPAPFCGTRPRGAGMVENDYNYDTSGFMPGLAQLISDRVLASIKRHLKPPAAPEQPHKVEPAPASLTEIPPPVVVVGNGDAPAVPDSGIPRPAVEHGPAAAAPELKEGGEGVQHMPSSRPHPIAGVVIRNGAMIEHTERMAPPEPFSETATDAADEFEAEEAIADAAEEIVAPAPAARPHTEASEAF